MTRFLQKSTEDPKFENISDNKYIKRLEQRLRVLERRAKLNDPLSIDVVDLGHVPSAKMRQTSIQSVGNAAWTTITMDVIDWDTMGEAANLAGETIKIRREGIYLVVGKTTWAANATGSRFCGFGIDGSIAWSFGGYAPVSNHIIRVPGVTMLELTAGQTVELMGYQDSGGNLNTNVAADSSCELSVALIAPRAP